MILTKFGPNRGRVVVAVAANVWSAGTVAVGVGELSIGVPESHEGSNVWLLSMLDSENKSLSSRLRKDISKPRSLERGFGSAGGSSV